MNGRALLLPLCLLFGCRATPVDRGLIEGEDGPIRWPSFPLTVVMEHDAPEDVVIEVVFACKWWNDNLEQFAFFPVAPGHSYELGDVLVFATAEMGRGLTHLRWNGSTIRRAYVEVPAFASSWVLRKIVRHELGHALGLDHDTIERSIMFDTVIPWGLEEVTEHDKQLFRPE